MSAKDNPVYIATPLSNDLLVIRQGMYAESLGQPFTLDAELISKDETIAFEKIMGKNVTLRFETDSNTRYINGIVTEFIQLENVQRNACYRTIIRPWFWLLTLSQHCRIFQQKTFPDIIKSVFDEMGFSDYKNKLTGRYKPQDYVVQFNESDFNFVSRIMQQEGIFYYFEHSNGKHTLVLCDDLSHAQDLGALSYQKLDEEEQGYQVEGIFEWENHQHLKPAGVSLDSYDFAVPSKNLLATAKDPKNHAFSQLQQFEYQGGYADRSAGEHYAKMLLEQHNAAHEIYHFTGNARAIGTGMRFGLTDHVRVGAKDKFIVTDYQCTVRTGELIKHLGENEQKQYECSGRAISAKVNFRPQTSIGQNKMLGPQTATVEGKTKGEVWTDKFGRIKVRFHWDNGDTNNPNSSCWIRIAQSMSGKNWGALSIPRVGQEVLVDFLQGDPNQPIVIGCVYNGTNMPPYPLPQFGHLSAYKSTKAGKQNQVNEIRFDDKKNQEQLYISAAKNQDILINNDCFETIGQDYHQTVKRNRLEKVSHDISTDIGGDSKTQIGKDASINIKGKSATQIGNTLSLSVSGNASENYASNLSIGVQKDAYIKAENICLEATNNITIQVGGSYIAMERGGIKIKSNGKVAIDADNNVTLDSGAKAEINAKNATSIKGKSVKIN